MEHQRFACDAAGSMKMVWFTKTLSFCSNKQVKADMKKQRLTTHPCRRHGTVR